MYAWLRTLCFCLLACSVVEYICASICPFLCLHTNTSSLLGIGREQPARGMKRNSSRLKTKRPVFPSPWSQSRPPPVPSHPETPPQPRREWRCAPAPVVQCDHQPRLCRGHIATQIRQRERRHEEQSDIPLGQQVNGQSTRMRKSGTQFETAAVTMATPSPPAPAAHKKLHPTKSRAMIQEEQPATTYS